MGDWVCLGVIALVVIGAGWLFSPWGEDWLSREQSKKSEAAWEAEQRLRAAERQAEGGGSA